MRYDKNTYHNVRYCQFCNTRRWFFPIKGLHKNFPNWSDFVCRVCEIRFGTTISQYNREPLR